MYVQNRLLRVQYSEFLQCLIASDVRGRVHKFDLNLHLIRSSPVVTYDRPINSICLSEKYIFTKDRFGSIGKWDINTLEPIDFYDGKLICDLTKIESNEEPSPTPNRGINLYKGIIYTNNGYNQMVSIDAETFEINAIHSSPSHTFFDSICTDHETVHAMTDVDGNIFFGNLETMDFPIKKQIDTMVIHEVVYDKRHKRFWTTQDGGLGDKRFCETGITTIEIDGTNLKTFTTSNEDNEFMEFTPDYKYLITGGFNGKILIFDNLKKEFNLIKTIGPLEFQIIHGAVVSIDRFYALLQTGELVCLNFDGKEIARINYSNKCVWTFEPHPTEKDLVFAGTDYGYAVIKYSDAKYGSVNIKQILKVEQGFPIVKDLKPFPDSSCIYISRKGYIVKSDSKGCISWSRQILGVPKGISVDQSYTKCLVATEQGTIWELKTENGELITTIENGSPAYACAYLSDGKKVITADKKQLIRVFDKHNQLIGKIDGFNYRIKRLIKTGDNQLFAAGPDGVFELDIDNLRIKKSFGAYMVSTKENCVLCNGMLYVGGYGYQLATYRYDTEELIDLYDTMPDFTKAFFAYHTNDNVSVLMVGGRGGFICLYKLYDGIPNKVREIYIN